MKNHLSPTKFSYKTNLCKGSLFLFLIIFNSGIAQSYRNPRAYIVDFGKNELFVKESLMEHANSVIEVSPEKRAENTLERIYTKLEDINTNLYTNDRGVKGDTGLRDAFIKLNNKTITLLKSKSNKLNDYAEQGAADYMDIFRNFDHKELEIRDYYSSITEYENSKKEFGLKYNINIRYSKKKNIFEYNAYQNLIFYQLNVLDEKLTYLLNEKNSEKVDQCMKYLTKIGNESLVRTNWYKDDFTDTSLNDANIELINFMIEQNASIIPLYKEYVSTANNFRETKESFTENSCTVSVEQYNTEVRNLNKAKKDFFDAMNQVQIKKKELIEKWYITNSAFLKRNIEYENLYQKFTDVD